MEKGSKMNNRLEDKSQDRKYFTLTPRVVEMLCDDVYELALWQVIKTIAGEKGECYIATQDLATLAMQSTGRASQSRKRLIKKGLLQGEIRRDPGYPQPVWHLVIPDLWERNLELIKKYPKIKDRITFKEQQKKSFHQVKPSPHEGPPSPGEGPPSPHETKKNHKKNHKDNQSAASNFQTIDYAKEFFHVGDDLTFQCSVCGCLNIKKLEPECPDCGLNIIWERCGYLTAKQKRRKRQLERKDGVAPISTLEMRVLRYFFSGAETWPSFRQDGKERRLYYPNIWIGLSKRFTLSYIESKLEWAQKINKEKHAGIGWDEFLAAIRNPKNIAWWREQQNEAATTGPTVIDMDPKPKVIVAEIAGFIHPERKVVLK